MFVHHYNVCTHYFINELKLESAVESEPRRSELKRSFMYFSSVVVVSGALIIDNRVYHSTMNNDTCKLMRL